MDNMPSSEIDPKPESPIIYWGFAGFVTIVTIILLYLYAPPTTDWWMAFHPIGRHIGAPYTAGIHFAYPPWTAVLLSPFTYIDIQLSRALFSGITMMICAYVHRDLGGDLITFVLLLTSIPFAQLIGNAQTDGIAILGLALICKNLSHTQIGGTLLILSKPQSFSFALPILFIQSKYKKELVVGVTLFLCLSFVIWGWWVPQVLDMVGTLYPQANLAIWPYGIPVGLGLSYFAYKQKNLLYGALATPFFAPYIAFYSFAGYLVILYAILPRRWSIALYLGCMILSALFLVFIAGQ